MRIVHLSYAHMKDQTDPHMWLAKLGFYTGILEALADEATVLSVHCISHEGILKKNRVEYHFLKVNHFEKHFPFSVNKYIKKLRPDIVIVHGLIYPIHVLLLKLILKGGSKIIVQHHAERPLTNMLKYIQPWSDRFVDGYFFCSLDLGEQWVKNGLIKDRQKISEVMEVSSRFGELNDDVARRASKISGDNRFLWVGGLHDRKDPLLMVQAFARFGKNRKGVHLCMIYQTSDLIQEVKDVIDKEDASDFITLVGEVVHEELVHWYNSAEFIVSTSKYEGSGVAVCEALSCGCIPILSDIPSFRMMTNYGAIGFLFKTSDIDGLVSCLEKSLDINVETERQKVLNQFEKNLSFQAIANKMMKLFRSLRA